VAKALELAANESSALGTSYVGTEHLLLGMIGEPDGVAGHVLRFLGADLRVTRRTVAAALAGWDAGSARAAQQEDAARHLADHVATAVRTELAPVLERIERLEGMAAR
jgi:ATP-dependent Clp protease ATP-binding subunit ClpC